MCVMFSDLRSVWFVWIVCVGRFAHCQFGWIGDTLTRPCREWRGSAQKQEGERCGCYSRMCGLFGCEICLDCVCGAVPRIAISTGSATRRDDTTFSSAARIGA